MKPVALNTVELPSTSGPRAAEPAAPAQAAEFTDALSNAIEKVDALQGEADTEAQKLANGDGNLHETMIALEKADVAMRVAMKVRSKLVEAYNDVMRMTV